MTQLTTGRRRLAAFTAAIIGVGAGATLLVAAPTAGAATGAPTTHTYSCTDKNYNFGYNITVTQALTTPNTLQQNDTFTFSSAISSITFDTIGSQSLRLDGADRIAASKGTTTFAYDDQTSNPGILVALGPSTTPAQTFGLRGAGPITLTGTNGVSGIAKAYNNPSEGLYRPPGIEITLALQDPSGVGVAPNTISCFDDTSYDAPEVLVPTTPPPTTTTTVPPTTTTTVPPTTTTTVPPTTTTTVPPTTTTTVPPTTTTTVPPTTTTTVPPTTTTTVPPTTTTTVPPTTTTTVPPTTTTTVPPTTGKADIAVTLSAPSAPDEKGTSTVKVTVRNNGPATSAPGKTTLYVAGGLRVVDGGGGSVSGIADTFATPALSAGQAIVYTVTLKVTQSLSFGVLAVINVPFGNDPRLSNNFAVKVVKFTGSGRIFEF